MQIKLSCILFAFLSIVLIAKVGILFILVVQRGRRVGEKDHVFLLVLERRKAKREGMKLERSLCGCVGA
jgi:hypothetical protein